jgi:hypothetical protein
MACILLYVASGLLKIMHSSPEVSVCKGMARTGFEVTFKLLGLGQGFKGNIEPEFPGFELKIGSVPALAVMMPIRRLRRLESPLKALQNSEGKFEGKDRTALT